MLAVTPLLILAYAVLYAFAAAIPKGAVELGVREALVDAASKLPVAKVKARDESATIRRSKRDTIEAQDTPEPWTKTKQGPIMRGGVVTLTTGEGQGFWHRCEGLAC